LNTFEGGRKMERKELIKTIKAKYPSLQVRGMDSYELQGFLGGVD